MLSSGTPRTIARLSMRGGVPPALSAPSRNVSAAKPEASDQEICSALHHSAQIAIAAATAAAAPPAADGARAVAAAARLRRRAPSSSTPQRRRARNATATRWPR